MSENPYRQDNPFLSDESFQENIKRLEADIDVLATEVRAWRHNDDVHECSLTTELEFLHRRSVKAHDQACEAAQRTDENGALNRAKAMEEKR